MSIEPCIHDPWPNSSLDWSHTIQLSKTNRHCRSEVLVNLPNLMIKRDDGTPIAWALLGTDGSLVSVHCEVSTSKDRNIGCWQH